MRCIELTETRAIIIPTLPPNVKFDITSVVNQLLNLKGVFVGLPTDDTNMHLTNFIGI